MTKQTNALWMLKFENSESKPSSINRFIPNKHLKFVILFKNILENNNIDLVYAGCNGPYVAHRAKGSKLPTKQWDLTIVTEHNNSSSLSLSYQDLKKTDEFNKLCKKYPLSIIYNIPFKIKDNMPSSSIVRAAGFSQFISRFIGFFFNSFDPTFGYFPPYPFKSASYEWMASLPKNKIGMDMLSQIHQLCTYKDEPFLMLNLMDIKDTASDNKYSRGVIPLLFAIGGRPSIVGTSDGNDWNQIFFVYYPNPKAFYEMSTSDNYVNKSMYKTKSKSTKDTFVQMTIPIYCQPKHCFGKMPSKL